MTRTRLPRWAAAVTSAVGLIAAIAPVAAARPAPDPDPVKIDSQVERTITVTGNTSFWVVLEGTADLSGAARIDDWAERGRFVHDRLREHAEQSQRPVREALEATGAKVRPYWAANAMLVTGGANALRAASGHDRVDEIVATRSFALPPTASTAVRQTAVQNVEWNVAEIGAPQVWADFGATGQGVTVGVIDTGADVGHPAIAGSYRGNGSGHDHNWWDPTGICGGQAAGPCDNNGHGTHVTGTIAGDGGPGNQIGVAPGARWISAKGCAQTDCPDSFLLSSMQWMLAPTDRNGDNPRPDLRPHVVNNSWSHPDGSLQTFRQAVQAWTAAGILGVFAAGNNGPGCATAGSPASFPEAYAVGAYDSSGAAAWFSSRGVSPLDSGVKPDVAAPGVGVRSSLPGGGYGLADGTSMAAPHVVGTVALIVSAAPALAGAVGDLRELLDQSARDAADTSCGGTPGDNNVFGEGRLSAYGAVSGAPRGPVGTITGTVTDAGTGSPVAGARIEATTDAQTRRTSTGADGRYRLVVSAGTVQVRALAFGYLDGGTEAEVADGGATTADLALTASARHRVSGTVATPDGAAATGVRVSILGSPLPAVLTGTDGAFAIDGVPAGSHTLAVVASACSSGVEQPLTVDGDEHVTLTVAPVLDARGYGCRLASPQLLPTTTVLPISGDTASYTMDLPFVFTLYGKATRQIRISVDGRIATDGRFLSADITGALPEGPLPLSAEPDGSIYPFWTDLRIDGQSSIRTGITGTAPNRAVVVEWREALIDFSNGLRITAQAVLGEDGTVRLQYDGLDSPAERGVGVGAPVVVGIEDETGDTASQFLFDTPSLSDDVAIVYGGPRAGALIGTVADGFDGAPLDANRRPQVVLRDQAGVAVSTLVPDAQGRFGAAAPPGEYTLEARATNYVTHTRAVTVAPGAPVDAAIRLSSGRPGYQAMSMSFTTAPGGRDVEEMVMTNVGDAPLSVWMGAGDPNYGDALWTSLPGPAGVELAPGQTGRIPVQADATGLAPGTYTGTVRVYSTGGRVAASGGYVPVTLVVSAYARSVDAGGPGLAEPAFEADRPYAADPGWGHTGSRSSVVRTTRAIGGTEADALYQTARSGDHGYRFTGLTDGTYQVQLHFAEIEDARAGDRRFDVRLNGSRQLAGLDVAAIAGQRTALVRTLTVRVTGGQLQVDLARNGGRKPPLLAGLVITHRPDLISSNVSRRAL